MWSGAYWIGLNDRGLANSWVYSNGDSSGYTNWEVGQPLDFEPYNCARVTSYGPWQSGRCDLTSEYFCMIKREHFKVSFFRLIFNFA